LAGRSPSDRQFGYEKHLRKGDGSIDRFSLHRAQSFVRSCNRGPAQPPKGDLNSDHIITSADATIALEIAVSSRPCDVTTLAAADMSRDGRVTSLDALMILQAAGRAR
jgi:hypothetical protein